MDTPGLTIYNLPPMPPRWDQVGVFYVAFCATWTTVVLAGMAFSWYNRHLPIMRVRGLPLAFGSVIFLHMYWCMAQITYPVGATMPIVIAYSVQYFVMGIWFPLGIALFHAANLRFLRVAKLQKQFTHPQLKRKRGCNGAHSSWLCKIRNMEYTTKIMSFITIGVVVQAFLTTGMWVACKKYHPTFGIPGTEIRGATLPEQLIDLGRGWEWWPSVVWQFIWTWGVAPFLIWRAWSINDTMGWRTQTIGACLSGLHATPMFLIASYVPAFNKVNAYFHPSQWIHLNTMFIEIFAVFVPVYEIIKLWHMNRKVFHANEEWEMSSQGTATRELVPSKGGSVIELAQRDDIYGYISSGPSSRLMTLTILNRVLQHCPAPLQEFSAHRDFSGENIAFLTRLSEWKSEWSNKVDVDEEQRINMFNAALQIYIDFISLHDAEFPLNLSCAHLKKIEAIFEKPARVICGKASINTAVPFAFEPRLYRFSSDSTLRNVASRARYTGEFPQAFEIHVFDEAEEHIKDLVLNNTWPKFVEEMQARRRSMDSEGSRGSNSSRATGVSRVTKFVRSLV
ncbi:hypothetical protein GQ44DRAFT_401661 [Phaeosphaeriaceae sp. PMI808]|nr:hypothetical protein GQ44DRAFT_401661 [Phaeosphaeriaceae sp. PMI808]